MTLGPLLDKASTPALTVNLGGDEVVSDRTWISYLGELCGRKPQIRVRPVDGSQPGAAIDWTLRRRLTGLCRVEWRAGLRSLVGLERFDTC
jgi:hypothetical protein